MGRVYDCKKIIGFCQKVKHKQPTEVFCRHVACNFIKKETQVFFYEFTEIFPNIFLTEDLWTPVSQNRDPLNQETNYLC